MAGKHVAAQKAIRTALLVQPDSADVTSAAIFIHRRAGEHLQVGEMASRLANAHPAKASELVTEAFDSFLRASQFDALEAFLKQLVSAQPDAVEPRRLLAQWFNAQGRRFEATQHVRHLIRMRAVQPLELLSMVDLCGPFDLVRFDHIELPRTESLLVLGDLRKAYAATEADLEAIARLTIGVEAQQHESPAASAFLGRLYAETGVWQKFQIWLEGLSTTPKNHPEYWHAMALWLQHQGQPRQAIGCWLEALRLDPTMRVALRELIATLEIEDGSRNVTQLRTWLADLDKVFRIARDADAKQAAWISERMNQWLRPWESSAWAMRSMQQNGTFDRAAITQLDQRRTQLIAWENNATEQQIFDARLTRQLPFPKSDWPLPDMSAMPMTANAPIAQVPLASDDSQSSSVANHFRFTDIASQVGLDVQVDTGYRIDDKNFYSYQPNGAGMAIIDYDLDGHSDLVVMQAGGRPNDEDGSKRNHVFRQNSSGQFVEVTTLCGAIDHSYGQGACVGDVNQDGLPDLLFANIGRNRLYINQGDGTFVQRPKILGDTNAAWTSSLGLADLDGDRLPDLIEVNYVDDPRAIENLCQDPYHNCHIQSFDPAADRAYRLSPDGVFEPWESVCRAMAATPKLGFGVIIADFDDRDGLDCFIANDGDFNHLWVDSGDGGPSQGTSSDPKQSTNFAPAELVEVAAVAGVAVGRNGNSQACMGVTADDFNRDGRLDLHVTNFFGESANLFAQTRPGLFSDQPNRFGLVEPSTEVLGFGTQAADWNNDGWPDLAVLNGHLFDSSENTDAFQMRPQMFGGNSKGFKQVPAETIGPYWTRPQLGRCLVTADWNRDGRLDLLANHLEHPVALLENRTDAGHWLQLELIGAQAERDAIGAKITLSSRADEGHRQSAWVVGGDGYMCSNESLAHFGLGTNKSSLDIEISWPSGTKQSVVGIQVDRRYVIVEGQPSFSR